MFEKKKRNWVEVLSREGGGRRRKNPARYFPWGYLFGILSLWIPVAYSLRYNYGNGSYFIGDVDNSGRPSGFGVFYNSTGNLEYRGEWKDGMPNGNGTWFGINGDVYEGEFRNGMAHGRVIHVTSEGDSLEGEFKKHLAHGKGILIGKDGHKIEGFFKKGMVHGPGVWQSPNGHKYEGMFRMGKPTGFAKVYDEKGNIMYEGKVEQKKLPFDIIITYGYTKG